MTKPSGSATCRAWRQQMWKSSIEKVSAKPTISASLAGCHRSTQLLAQVAERRGGLVADGAAGEGGRGLGQGAELPADIQPIGGCLAREATGASCPRGGGQPRQLMLPALATSIEDAAELALEAVDGGAQPLGVDLVIVRLEVEIADRALEPFEFDRQCWNYANLSS